MNRTSGQNVLALLALFLALASCGPSPQAGGGIGGTGNTATVVSAPITGFGSVFVSGDEYETGHTSMMVDRKPGSQSDLKKGMMVRVNATLTKRYDTNEILERTANTLLYEDTIEGVMQSVASDGSRLMVLGQTVTITPTTTLDTSIPGSDVRRLVPDRDLVEISGFVTGDGMITATFVGLKTFDIKTETPDYQVKGFIKNHKVTQKTFEIGALTVDYRDAVLNDMPGQLNELWDGLLVDVDGKQVSSGGAGLSGVRMTATLVWPEGLGSEDSEYTNIEGFVTHVFGPGEFSIGNVRVLTNADTMVEGGALSDIKIGAHLEVHGPLIAGIVNATKVEFE